MVTQELTTKIAKDRKDLKIAEAKAAKAAAAQKSGKQYSSPPVEPPPKAPKSSSPCSSGSKELAQPDADLLRSRVPPPHLWREFKHSTTAHAHVRLYDRTCAVHYSLELDYSVVTVCAHT